MLKLKKEIKGIILATVIGLLGYFISSFLPSSFNSILMALLLGIIVGNFIKIPGDFQSGIGFTSSRLLELSILFLAFSINYKHIAALGVESFSAIFIMVILMLLVSYYLAKKVKFPGSTGWLIGFGTTICGSSAIAALAPTVSKNKDDVGISMAVVNLFGSIGMILMPFILIRLNISTQEMGLLIGGTLHSVGNVVGAGYSLGNEVGEAAITIKLARVALLSPALIFFNFLVNRHQVTHWKEHFSLPWYLWSFIAITVITSFISFPQSFIKMMDDAGKLVLTIAMAAIGLKVSFKTIYLSGQKGLIFGLIAFAAQILIITLCLLMF